jgi:O-antigen/teichoic acid export membrane protein
MLKESNKRIAKNTIFLYLRMMLIMIVSLYTTRVVLDYLGVEDFGIYNIVGGIVVLLGFFQNALNNASERFITYELGKGNNLQQKRTFSMIMTSLIIISLLVLILAETVGWWFVNTQLNIADDKIIAVKWVYQFSVFTFIINILRTPYNATIIAHEEMSFYAYISIIESVFRLGAVIILPFISFDKLIVYGILMFLVPLLITVTFKVYCNIKFKISKYKFEWDKELFSKIMSFSSWSMLSGIANIGARQGGNILLNIFSGLVANAAYGISNQIGAAISTFASNLLIAFNPQIIKQFASKDTANLHKLIFRAASFSFYLTMVIAVPFILNTEFILNIWLKNVPDYTVVFCQLIIIYQMIDMIQAPLTTLISATGNIKSYQIWLSSILILNIPISWYLLKTGWSPYWIIIIRIILNFISSIIRIIYVNYFVNFPSWQYFRTVVIKASIVTFVSFSLSILIKQLFNTGISGFIYTTVFSIVISGLVIYLIGVNKPERTFVNSILKKLAPTKMK